MPARPPAPTLGGPVRAPTELLTLAVAACGSSSRGSATSVHVLDRVHRERHPHRGRGDHQRRLRAGARRYSSGPLTFKVANKDATGVTEIELLSGERILGEKENLPPGFSGTLRPVARPPATTPSTARVRPRRRPP